MVLKMSMSFTRSIGAQAPGGRAGSVTSASPRATASGDLDLKKEMNQTREKRGHSTASSSSSCSSFMDEVGLDDEKKTKQPTPRQLKQQQPRASVAADGSVHPALIEISLARELEDEPSQSDLEAIEDLIECAKEGDLPLFMRLCESLKRRHITPDCAGYMDWTPAHWAAREGHVHLLEYLYQNEVNLDILDKKGDSLLHKAAANGQFRICQWLLQHGFNVQARNNNRQTPLDVAQELKAMAKTNESALCEAILSHENANTF